MTSTIKVNNIQNQCGTAYIQRCGTTITLGTSGDNITLACGATQTGFGRTGTVNWDTTAKTASFTAVTTNGYFVNTTSASITVTLPASPSSGDIVAVKDYAGTFATNNCIIGRNGSNIDGQAEDLTLDINGQSVTLVYVDATKGWLVVNDSNVILQEKFVSATGGTITTVCSDYKVHTFTGPGTFTVTCAGNALGSNSVDYLVIGGGGGASGDRGGGGGAGGYRFSNGTASGCYSAGPAPLGASALPVAAQAYPITVGGGGAGAPGPTDAGSGNNSVFSTITSTGGGKSARQANTAGTGGSGGGGAGIGPNANSAGAAGNTPPVSPSQGNNGGDGNGCESGPVRRGGGGGGGANAAGTTATTSQEGNGGSGLTSCITASPVGRGGGGGGGGTGGAYPNGGSATDGGGSAAGNAGTANTGGGGGGRSLGGGGSNSGGSGIVVIRYRFQ
jgi:hypothetical protein